MQPAKLKTLYILEFLKRYSDEEYPLSSRRLLELLEEKGIHAERKSIYSDIEALREIGYDIVSVRTPKKGFFMASRTFEVPEVRLLIDAVMSAGFITPGKTQALIEKLEGLVSENQAKQMVSQVYCETAAKCENESIYIIIDCLDRAIHEKKKVRFTYRRRNIDRLNKKSYSEKVMRVSPYALLWKGDHYYLVCNNEKYDNLMNLRIDRIKCPTILYESARPVAEVSDYKTSFDRADYAAKMFNMFSGKTRTITLKCTMDMREEIMDRFGKSVPLTALDVNHFETRFDAAVSDGLVSWVMQFGDQVQVTSPSEVREMIQKKAESICKIYASSVDEV